MAFDQQFNWDMDRLIRDLTAQRKKRLAFDQSIQSREMAESERQGSFLRNQARSELLSTGLDKNYDRQLANDRITSRKHDEYAVNDGSLDKNIFGMRWGESSGGTKSSGHSKNQASGGSTFKDRFDMVKYLNEDYDTNSRNPDTGEVNANYLNAETGKLIPRSEWVARELPGFEKMIAGPAQSTQAPAEKRKEIFRSFVDKNGVFHSTNYGEGQSRSWDNPRNKMQTGLKAMDRNARWAGQNGKGNAPTELGELLKGIGSERKRPPVDAIQSDVINIDTQEKRKQTDPKKDLPIPDNITSEDVSGFLKSQHTNPLDPLYGRTVGESIWTKGQNFMNKSRVDDDAIWTGESILTAAMRQSDIGGTLGERKEMAYGLKKKYPKLSEEQLAQIIAKGKSKKTSRNVAPTKRKAKKDEWTGSW